MNLKQELRELASHFGVNLFGVAPASCLADAPEGHTATDILTSARSIIVLAMKMLDTQIDILPVMGKRKHILANHHDKKCMPLMEGMFPDT